MIPKNICIICKHYLGQKQCAAFPKGIPDAIYLTAKHDHRTPYPGDNGIRFEPIKEAAHANRR